VNGLRLGGQGVYDLVNKVAVVAGCSGGIGAAAARRFAAAGATVVVGYHRGAARAGVITADLPGKATGLSNCRSTTPQRSTRPHVSSVSGTERSTCS
jgi:NAD(P)-dependent dehydrogenase (short-subunit alcohol dehydrogenase family)